VQALADGIRPGGNYIRALSCALLCSWIGTLRCLCRAFPGCGSLQPCLGRSGEIGTQETHGKGECGQGQVHGLVSPGGEHQAE